MRLRNWKRIIVMMSVVLSLPVFSPTTASSNTLRVKVGAECQLIDVPVPDRFTPIHKLWVWDEKTESLILYRCVRNDQKPFPSGEFANCGSSVSKKYILKKKGPKCVWTIPLHPKKKKPSVYSETYEGLNPNVGSRCVYEGYARGSHSEYVHIYRDNELYTLDCEKGVWAPIGNAPKPFPALTPKPKRTSSEEPKVNTKTVCNNFANALIAYSRTARYATSMFEMQLVTRQLSDATYAIQDLTLRDRSLDPLATAVGILVRHVQAQGPGGSGIPVNSDVLRLAVGTFNGYCGTSIYVS